MFKFGLILLAVAVAAAPARAANLDVKFTGTVQSQSGSAVSVGSRISGEFVYQTESSRYGFFTIAGLSVSPGFVSTAQFSLDLYSALYQAQISAVQQGGNVNQSFVLDLEGLNPWSSASAVTLLTDPAQIASNTDLASNPNSFSPSTFGYYIADASGNNVNRVSATLETLSVAVPEPATLTLLGTGLVALFVRRRRA